MISFFFFSSRRRHTRYIGDWSSDVCSSDLESVKDNNQKNHDVEKVAEPAAPPDTPKEAPKPAVTRFLFISKFALIHDLAWQVRKEGFEVKYHIMSKADRDVGDGFVEKVDRWEDFKDWADV